MKALLLAAGYGTRLRPITTKIPKCLVPINGKPLLFYWLEMLKNAGVNEILINTHYLSEVVVDIVSNSEYSHLVKFVFEEKLLGTGGTLLKNMSFFNNEKFILIHADNFSIFDINNFIKFHEERAKHIVITMLTFITDDPKNCGIVTLDSKSTVIEYTEKINNPKGNIANGAVYIIEPIIFDFLKNINKKDIDFSKDVLPFFVNKILSFQDIIYHRDIGTIRNYEIAKNDFLKFLKI